MFWFWNRRPTGKKGRPRSRPAVSLQSIAFERNRLAAFVEPLEARCLLSASPTTLTVAPSASSLTYGQTVSLTATVTGTTVPSEGTVTFMDGATTLGTQSVSGGTATLANVVLPVGIDVITAKYTDPLGTFADSSTALGPNSIIQTVAGTGGYSGDGGPATAATFEFPNAVAVDSAGDLFIVDPYNNVIREVNAVTHIITTVAGNGLQGYSGDGGQATAASLNAPEGVVVDAAGDLYIADTNNNRIREVNAVTHIITTVAGGSSSLLTIITYASAVMPAVGEGDGGQATAAELNSPAGIAVDSSGDIFIADFADNLVREVNAVTHLITTVAGNGSQGFSGDGGLATAAALDNPTGIAVDQAGDLFIADSRNERIREVKAVTQLITTVAGNGTAAYSGDGGLALDASLDSPGALAVDSAGDLFVIDASQRVREINAETHIITTVAGNAVLSIDPIGYNNSSPPVLVGSGSGAGYAYLGGYSGDGGPATAAALNQPAGIAVDAAGNLFIADSLNNRIREVNAATQVITTVAGNGSYTFNGDGHQATATQMFPYAVAVDSAGDLFIADFVNGLVREINAVTDTVTTIAGGGNGGVAGPNGPATEAALGGLAAIALDASGDVFIAVGGVIREVNAVTQIITTVAGTGNEAYGGDGGQATAASIDVPSAIAVDSAGDLFISESYRIREVNAVTGIISTVAGTGVFGYSGDGGSATAASIDPTGIAIDAAGDLLIADTGSNRIREVNAVTHVITTIAGGGNQSADGNFGDGGPATSAVLVNPSGVALDSAGNIFIAERGRVTEVNAATGVINTVAGNGSLMNGIDNGPATAASLNYGAAIAVDASGDLFITNSDRLLEVPAGTTVTVHPAATPAPSSRVVALAPRTSQTSIAVSWSRTAGTGGPITSYNISVSIDSGPFMPWLTGTTHTSSTYPATFGHTYSFISQARDADGDVEPAHATPDTTVTVTAAPWQNPGNPLDVLGTGGPIVPADALALIDYLNSHPTTGTLPPNFPAGSDYFDVLGTGTVGPADLLKIINYLNNQTTAKPAVAPAVLPAISPGVSPNAATPPPTADSVSSGVVTSDSISSEAEAHSSPLDFSAVPAQTQSLAPAVGPALMAASQISGAVSSSLTAIPNLAVAASPGESSQPSVGRLAATVSPLTPGVVPASDVDALLADARLNWLDDLRKLDP